LNPRSKRNIKFCSTVQKSVGMMLFRKNLNLCTLTY